MFILNLIRYLGTQPIKRFYIGMNVSGIDTKLHVFCHP
jgi:hypothetical protein